MRMYIVVTVVVMLDAWRSDKKCVLVKFPYKNI